MRIIILFACFFCISVCSIMAFTFEDAILKIGPDMKGQESAIENIEILHKIITQTRSDETSLEFLDYLDDSLQEFDFKKLYEYPVLTSIDNGYRGVVLAGINEKDAYYIGIIPKNYNDIILRNFGSFKSEVSLKKIDKSIVGYRSFSGRMKTKIALTKYCHINLLSFIEGLLQIIDPANIKSLDSKESTVFTNITGDAKKVINEFNNSYPQLSVILDRYIHLRSLCEIKMHNNIPYTHFNLKCSGIYKTIKKDYPLIAKYIDQFKDVIKTSVASKNSKGNTILDMDFDCSKDFFAISLYTKSGKLIPYNEKKEPVFDDAFLLTDLKTYDFNLESKLFFNAYGLKYQNDKILSKCKYLNTPKMSALSLKLAEVSKTKVFGRKYHVIPKWLIDFMIPASIDQLIYELVHVMLNANEGKGSSIQIEFDLRKQENIFFKSTASSEFVDNFFIKLELGIWRSILKTNSKTIDQINNLCSKSLDSLINDLNSMNIAVDSNKKSEDLCLSKN